MSDPVSCTAVLPIGESTVVFLSGLLAGQRVERRTRKGRRALGSYRHAVLALRWFLDGTRVAQLATDNQHSLATAYRHLHKAIDVLAALAPSLHGALLAARTAGHSHVHIDGTLIRTDRSKAAGPTAGVDLWWSGNHHHHHGGNVQVVTAPDGWPLWTSLGHEGENTRLTCPITNTRGATLTAQQRTINTLHSATRALAERGNSLLKTTFKGLRRVTPCPWRIAAIIAAALTLLHHEHDRTT